MPLDIENNLDTPKVEIKISKTIELTAVIHYLSDRSHHSFPDKLANALENKLSSESLKLLKLLSSMRLQGLELFEFIIKERAFDDVEFLVKKISEYDDLNFIYTLLGEVLDYSEIKQVKTGRLQLSRLLQDKPVLVSKGSEGLVFLFDNTGKFKNDIVKLIKEMNNKALMGKMDSLKEDYGKAIEKVKAMLKDKSPLDAAQEIMNRQFKRVFNFREYYFIPSYFISPHKLRVYCSDAQMVVFALEEEKSSMAQMGDRLSQIFKIISDRTRLEILRVIIEEPTYGKLLAEKLNLTTATISHHIEVLKSANLIEEKRIKNIKYFAAKEQEIKKLFKEGIDYLFTK